MYEATQFLLSDAVVFRYKVKTIKDLPPGIAFSTPVYLSYTTLPLRFGDQIGRKTTIETEQVI